MCVYICVRFGECGHFLQFKTDPCQDYMSDLIDPRILIPTQQVPSNLGTQLETAEASVNLDDPPNQGDVGSANVVDLKVLSSMLRAAPYDNDCPLENISTGLPLHKMERTWLASGNCGLRFRFSCTSVGSGRDHYSFKKFRRFFRDQLNVNQPETIKINEPCKGCGGSGMWNGIDISHTDRE